FGGTETRCQCARFVFRMRQITLCYAVARPKDITPPGEQYLDQPGAALQVKTLGERLVVFLAFFQPRAVGRILVACYFAFQCFVCFSLHILPGRTKQMLKFLTESIGKLNSPAFLTQPVL